MPGASIRVSPGQRGAGLCGQPKPRQNQPALVIATVILSQRLAPVLSHEPARGL